ncbi:MAG: polysaccharide biosynthesis/export family protein [Acidobacteria bacterium]|nr:polysaccharide biosynthesis/export family protein [Acidobacteriota bacterium]
MKRRIGELSFSNPEIRRTQLSGRSQRAKVPLVFLLCVFCAHPVEAQKTSSATPPTQSAVSDIVDWNQRLAQRHREQPAGDYWIGPHDLLEISIFEAPEMNRAVRVSAGGEISLPLLGAVRAAGLSPQQLEQLLQQLLRARYMKDPHVGVFVREMESHPVSVFGAVAKPGVYQIRGVRTLIEVLSLAQGLADDAGDTVLVLPGSATTAAERPEEGAGSEERPAALEVSLKELLESGEERDNVPIYPGDIVKVARAGLVYVVGDVKKPGAFVLRSNENISVLQALALAEGANRTAATKHARIIRTGSNGERRELVINLNKVLGGKAHDPLLEPNDILFVPNSAARSAFFRGLEAAVGTLSGIIIYRR